MSPEPDDQLQSRNPEQIAINTAIRLGVLVALLYVSFAIIRPFGSVLIWSAILTVATRPLFLWLRAQLGGRGKLASAILIAILIVLVIGPIAALTSSFVVSLEGLAARVTGNGFNLPTLPHEISGLPLIGQVLEKNWTLASSDFPAFIQQYEHTLAGPGQWLFSIVEGLAGSILTFAIAVIVSGFLQHSAPVLEKYIRDIASHMVGPNGTRFVSLARMTIGNVAQGVIGIAVMQAIAMGMVLIATGAPHAGLFAAVTLLLAITQISTALLMVPLMIWFWITKDWTIALAFSVAMVPIYALEGIGKPILMSRGLDTPMIITVIGVLGGTLAYGLPGLFLGPIVLAVSYELVLLWISGKSESKEQLIQSDNL